MKKRIRKLIALGLVSFILANNSFIVFAEDIQEPIKPTEPIGENITNEQIIEYNQEVDNYNQEVDNYNTQIDINYEQEKAEIDEENADIETYNQAEDAKAAAIKEENEQLQNKYNEEYAQYEEDLATYNKKEQQIINAGYQSVEQYNNTMNAYYNEPYDAAVEGNVKEENTFDINESYIIETAEDTSETTEIDEDAENLIYKVEIEHNFNEKDAEDEENDILIKSYKTEFEINKNDIITFNPAGAQLETYQNQYHYGFFANIDENHTEGYWYLGNSILHELCNFIESGWNTGDTHTLSYKDGQSKPGDPNLKMVYNYYWKALRKVKTYVKPEAPQLELKEEYTPEYKEKLADPEKKEYLTYLNHLELKEELKPEPENPTPVVVPTPVQIEESSSSSTPAAAQEVAPAAKIKPVEDIAIVETELIKPVEEACMTSSGNIHITAPQTGDNVDYIVMLLTILIVIAIGFFVAYFKYNKKYNKK